MFSEKKSPSPPKGNYYKALDGKLWDFLDSLGNQELGDFDPLGGVYGHEPYSLGEVPLAVLSKHIRFNVSAGKGYRRLEQLADDGLINIRKTGKCKPSFVSLACEDHDEYFRRAGKSRKHYGEINNPKLSAEAVAYLNTLPNDEIRKAQVRKASEAKGWSFDRLWANYKNGETL